MEISPLAGKPAAQNMLINIPRLITKFIERIVRKQGRKIYDTPVGFKWFVDGLLYASACSGGEESAGASSSRLDGSVCTTNKGEFKPALLSAEITVKTGNDPGKLYNDVVSEFSELFYDRVEAKATPGQKETLKELTASQIRRQNLPGEEIKTILANAPGNNARGLALKRMTSIAWFAERPSGTEDRHQI